MIDEQKKYSSFNEFLENIDLSPHSLLKLQPWSENVYSNFYNFTLNYISVIIQRKNPISSLLMDSLEGSNLYQLTTIAN